MRITILRNRQGITFLRVPQGLPDRCPRVPAREESSPTNIIRTNIHRLIWVAYCWSNGTTSRGNGVRFGIDDFPENDRMHESAQTQRKVGNLLLQFFKTDSTTKGWFLRKQ